MNTKTFIHKLKCCMPQIHISTDVVASVPTLMLLVSYGSFQCELDVAFAPERRECISRTDTPKAFTINGYKESAMPLSRITHPKIWYLTAWLYSKHLMNVPSCCFQSGAQRFFHLCRGVSSGASRLLSSATQLYKIVFEISIRVSYLSRAWCCALIQCWEVGTFFTKFRCFGKRSRSSAFLRLQNFVRTAIIWQKKSLLDIIVRSLIFSSLKSNCHFVWSNNPVSWYFSRYCSMCLHNLHEIMYCNYRKNQSQRMMQLFSPSKGTYQYCYNRNQSKRPRTPMV